MLVNPGKYVFDLLYLRRLPFNIDGGFGELGGSCGRYSRSMKGVNSSAGTGRFPFPGQVHVRWRLDAS